MHESVCFISDKNTHDQNFVYQIQTILVNILKTNYVRINKLFYFSDGCAGQHKNFVNQCHGKLDFGIAAKQIFVTSHGNSPCDGIGSLVKQYGAKRSQQRPLQDQILGYVSMFNLCQNEIKDIIFFFVSVKMK